MEYGGIIVLAVVLVGAYGYSVLSSAEAATPNLLHVGVESQWAMPSNSSMNVCYSYAGYGGKTIDKIQGTMGSMTFGLDEAQHSNVLVAIYVSSGNFQSGPSTYHNPCTVDGTALNHLNAGGILQGKDAVMLAPIIHKIYGNESVNGYFSYDLNYTIPENYYINVFTAADTSSQTNAWIDTELQSIITFN